MRWHTSRTTTIVQQFAICILIYQQISASIRSHLPIAPILYFTYDQINRSSLQPFNSWRH